MFRSLDLFFDIPLFSNVNDTEKHHSKTCVIFIENYFQKFCPYTHTYTQICFVSFQAVSVRELTSDHGSVPASNSAAEFVLHLLCSGEQGHSALRLRHGAQDHSARGETRSNRHPELSRFR